MTYEERQKAICKKCTDYNTSKCPYVIRNLRCPNLSNQMEGWELGYKDAINSACKLLENIFHDRSHHSGRGDAGEIVTYDLDSMQEFILKFRKAMEEQQ